LQTEKLVDLQIGAVGERAIISGHTFSVGRARDTVRMCRASRSVTWCMGISGTHGASIS
jgi:hypothetical protein